MTVLVGSSTTTGFTTISGMAGLAGRANLQLYTASASGTVTSLNYYWGDRSVGAESLKLFLCNSSGLVIASTGVITTPASGIQFVGGAVTPVEVVNSTQYYIALYAALTNNGGDERIGAASNGNSSREDTTSGSYASPPATFASISVNAGLPNWLAYADGTASGSATAHLFAGKFGGLFSGKL